jgi:hypothetical protein
VQVRRRCIRTQVRPERVEDLVARHAVAGGEREQLHEVGSSPLRPRVGRDRPGVDEDAETSEQPHLEPLHRRATLP